MKNLLQSLIYPPPETPLHKLRYSFARRINVDLGGTFVLLDTSSSHVKSQIYPVLKREGFNEPDTVEIVKSRCKADTCFFDVGSHLGIVALLAGKLCPDGSVHAFDLDPRSIVEIEQNAALNELKNINPVCAAVWNVSGNVLSFAPAKVGDLSTNRITSHPGNSNVLTITLKHYCEQVKAVPNFVKVDVEGAEVAVLQGMGDLLDKVSTLLVEVHPEQLPSFGVTLEDLEQTIAKQDFSLYVVDSHRKARRQTRKIELHDIKSIQNNSLLICQRQ